MSTPHFDLDGAIAINPSHCVLAPPPDIFAADVAATFPEPEGAENSAYLSRRSWWMVWKTKPTRQQIDLQEPLAWKARKF